MSDHLGVHETLGHLHKRVGRRQRQARRRSRATTIRAARRRLTIEISPICNLYKARQDACEHAARGARPVASKVFEAAALTCRRSPAARTAHKVVGVVYKITCTVTRLAYVGLTMQDLGDRMSGHRAAGKKSSWPGKSLGSAIAHRDRRDDGVICAREQSSESESDAAWAWAGRVFEGCIPAATSTKRRCDTSAHMAGASVSYGLAGGLGFGRWVSWSFVPWTPFSLKFLWGGTTLVQAWACGVCVGVWGLSVALTATCSRGTAHAWNKR